MKRALLLIGSLAACSSGSDRFAEQVLPVLERRCAAPTCHGVAPGAERTGEIIDRKFFYLDLAADGTIASAAAAYATTKTRINTLERAEFSTLLRKPLAVAYGGIAHQGGAEFAGTDDPAYQTILDWIRSETGGGEGASPATLTPLEQRFAREVQPVLLGRGCMIASCHGPLGFSGTNFDPPAGGASGEFSVAQIKSNHELARRNLSFQGDPTRSRLLVKALALAAGGIGHKGANSFFPTQGDPGAQAILGWARAERAAAVGSETGTADALVFVRGPARPRATFDLTAFRPGSDLYVLAPIAPDGALRNLTAAVHLDGPADIRDPAVSHDGQRVVFAMRKSADDCHNIYELGLDGSGLRQLTFDHGTLASGAKAANVQPTYGPWGRILYISTAHGTLANDGRTLNSDLYELLPDRATPRRRTFTPGPEARPTLLAAGAEFAGTVALTVGLPLGDAHPAELVRFPLDLNPAYHIQPEYHPHFGKTAPGHPYGVRELPDGRETFALLPPGAMWEGGALAILERQFGPELPAGQEANAAAPAFKHSLTVLSTDGLWRDPAALPDGRIVAAHAPGFSALTDAAAAAPDTGLVIVTLAPDGTIATTDPLVDVAGLADDQPQPVYVRPDEDLPHPDGWDENAKTGIVRVVSLTTDEAVASHLAPMGPRPVRTDAAMVRVIAAMPDSPADCHPVDPQLVRNGDPASTTMSNGAHGRAFIVAEAPLPADGSALVEAPAHVPVRVQLLDANRMAIGGQLNFWVDVNPGQTFPVGIRPDFFPQRCGGCHGTASGVPGDVLQPMPDAITGPSVVDALYAGRNLRRPQTPIPLGAATIVPLDFQKDLQPVLDRSCAPCHSGTQPAGGLSLTNAPTAFYNDAYESLLALGSGSGGGKKYVDERGSSARRSYLIEKIYGMELDAERTLTQPCPPPGAQVPPLSDDEKLRFVRWADLGAQWQGSP